MSTCTSPLLSNTTHSTPKAGTHDSPMYPHQQVDSFSLLVDAVQRRDLASGCFLLDGVPYPPRPSRDDVEEVLYLDRAFLGVLVEKGV